MYLLYDLCPYDSFERNMKHWVGSKCLGLTNQALYLYYYKLLYMHHSLTLSTPIGYLSAI